MGYQRITIGSARRIKEMLDGASVPFSAFYLSLANELMEEGFLTASTSGSHGSYRIIDPEGCRRYLADTYGVMDLNQWIGVKKSKETVTRAEQVAKAGDSKLRKTHVFKGFLVNSYAPVNAVLRGEPFVVCPPAGTSLYIEDYEHFQIPEDVVVVGVENGENFHRIRGQQYLFQNLNVLFVSRYPRSADLRTWLMKIPNRYIHFGDFDLAGINIFQSEFYFYLGKRAEFLIPEDIERRLENGNNYLYEKQDRFKDLLVMDERLESLVEMIHRYRRGYEQEGYIKMVSGK